MQEQILTFAPAAWYYSSERCHINELSNTSADPAVSIAKARVEPGIATRWHRLQGITERYVLLAGAGKVEVGSLPAQEVVAGTVVLIPPGCAQRITNTGTTDLVFLAICSPRFRQDAYEDIDPEPLED